MKKKIMSLVLAAAMVMSLGAGFSAGAVVEVDGGAPIDPLYDLEMIMALPESDQEITYVENAQSPTGSMMRPMDQTARASTFDKINGVTAY